MSHDPPTHADRLGDLHRRRARRRPYPPNPRHEPERRGPISASETDTSARCGRARAEPSRRPPPTQASSMPVWSPRTAGSPMQSRPSSAGLFSRRVPGRGPRSPTTAGRAPTEVDALRVRHLLGAMNDLIDLAFIEPEILDGLHEPKHPDVNRKFQISFFVYGAIFLKRALGYRNSSQPVQKWILRSGDYPFSKTGNHFDGPTAIKAFLDCNLKRSVDHCSNRVVRLLTRQRSHPLAVIYGHSPQRLTNHRSRLNARIIAATFGSSTYTRPTPRSFSLPAPTIQPLLRRPDQLRHIPFRQTRRPN